jgi:N-acetylneuraminic acid mutarotase
MRLHRLFILAALVSIGFAANAEVTCVPSLPVPHANNAVTSLVVDGKTRIYSFAGLRGGKTWQDASKAAFEFTEGVGWKQIKDMPIPEGVLAASAEAINGKIYIFGGYTVAEDGSEKSTPQTLIYDPIVQKYTRGADMPTPVDDMVTFVYQDRYTYLVSGWHDVGNVSLVQIYDTKADIWLKGTDYPGTPVFGHAGGIVGNQFVIADGVAVVGKTEEGRRVFDTVNEGWMGTINPNDPTHISYRRLPQLPGRGHYRMAGFGDAKRNQVTFVGGTSTAYNYSGIGYDGSPAKASAHVFAWGFNEDTWIALKDKPTPSMDHRGAVQFEGNWWTVGGLDENRKVTGDVLSMRTDNCPESVTD